MGNLCYCKQNSDCTISSQIKQQAKKHRNKSSQDSFSMKRSDFQIRYEMQEGRFGKCCMVHHKLTNEEYIMKIISKKKLEDYGLSIQRSPQILLYSPYISQAFGSFTTGAYIYIIGEYVYGTNLVEEINSQGPMKENIVQRLSAQILLALQEFHKRNIVYRNLTPARILIDEFFHVKLVNFGIQDFILQPRGTKVATFSQDYFYKSPEQLKGEDVTFASDFWQLGVCIYEMLTGRRLFNRSDKDLYREQVLDDSLDLPSNLSSDVASLLINLLCKDPSCRPGKGLMGIQDLKSHRFFSRINWMQKERNSERTKL